MWLRYVDNTLIQENVQKLLDHVNSIQPSIQFTMEKEKDNKLLFLDVLVTRTETEQGLRSSVYFRSVVNRDLRGTPSDYKFPQLSRTLLSILAGFSRIVIRMVSVLFQISSSVRFFIHMMLDFQGQRLSLYTRSVFGKKKTNKKKKK